MLSPFDNCTGPFMADVFSAEKRREVMSRIRSTNTKPELLVRRFLFSKGLRFRLHAKQLPGRPDIVLRQYETVVFVHGCFWHGHRRKTCKNTKRPRNNARFWSEKIENNARRDERAARQLRKLGWKVLTIWECDLKRSKLDSTLRSLYRKILIRTP